MAAALWYSKAVLEVVLSIIELLSVCASAASIAWPIVPMTTALADKLRSCTARRSSAGCRGRAKAQSRQVSKRTLAERHVARPDKVHGGRDSFQCERWMETHLGVRDGHEVVCAYVDRARRVPRNVRISSLVVDEAQVSLDMLRTASIQFERDALKTEMVGPRRAFNEGVGCGHGQRGSAGLVLCGRVAHDARRAIHRKLTLVAAQSNKILHVLYPPRKQPATPD